MAITYTINKESVVGDMRCQLATITTDTSPTVAIATGMSYLYGGSVTSTSTGTAAPGLTFNATPGSFSLAGGANSKIYEAIIFGR